tara:strand:- start:387 stop:740 length:354 start_codon:yes stop_codon:yes gene_type:complete
MNDRHLDPPDEIILDLDAVERYLRLNIASNYEAAYRSDSATDKNWSLGVAQGLRKAYELLFTPNECYASEPDEEQEPDYSDADYENHYAVKLRNPSEAERDAMEYAADLAYDAQRES